MIISLDNIGKRYHRDWIFRHLGFELSSGQIVALTGSNGSGKSTFLSILSGFLRPSEGLITWTSGQPVSADEVYREVAWTSPAQSLYEELTLREAIRFHCKFKSLRIESSEESVAGVLGLEANLDKSIRHFSSGMKQRVKLGLAILSQTPVLLLDEPSSHLDRSAIDWYSRLLDRHAAGRLVVIASNRVEQETQLCNRTIELEGYKGNAN